MSIETQLKALASTRCTVTPHLEHFVLGQDLTATASHYFHAFLIGNRFPLFMLLPPRTHFLDSSLDPRESEILLLRPRSFTYSRTPYGVSRSKYATSHMHRCTAASCMPRGCSSCIAPRQRERTNHSLTFGDKTVSTRGCRTEEVVYGSPTGLGVTHIRENSWREIGERDCGVISLGGG